MKTKLKIESRSCGWNTVEEFVKTKINGINVEFVSGLYEFSKDEHNKISEIIEACENFGLAVGS